MELISRADAIKDAESWVAVDEHERHLQKNVIEWLKEFPPAELGTNLASLGADCISRHVAIDAIERAKQNIHHNIERAIGDAVCGILDEVENGIKQLPPIQPEIIMCKECRYKERKGVDYYCDHITGEEIMVSPNDYCSWAERETYE